jgi:hypothetical protein
MLSGDERLLQEPGGNGRYGITNGLVSLDLRRDEKEER